MPAKKTEPLSDEERARRIRETAQEIGTSDDPKAFEKVFGKFAERAKASPEKPKAPGR